MKFLRLKCKNFKRYVDVDIDLSQVKLASIVGQWEEDPFKSNGSAKSTIGDAIMYALFDYSGGDDVTVDDFINWDSYSDSMSVELDFVYEGNQYKIEKGISKKNNKKFNEFNFYINGELEGKGLKERRKILSDTLGIDSDIARATWFFLQGNSNKLTSSKPAERKEYLSSVIGSDKYSFAFENAKSVYKSTESKLESSKESHSKLEDVKKEIASAMQSIQILEDNEKKLIDKERELNKEIEEVASKIAVIENSINELGDVSSLDNKISSVSNEVDSLKKSVAIKESKAQSLNHNEEKALELTNIRKELESKRVLLINKWKQSGYREDFKFHLNESYNQWMVHFSSIREKYENLIDKKSKIDSIGAICDTCGQEIGEDYIGKHRSDLDFEISRLSEELHSFKIKEKEYIETIKSANEDDSCLKEVSGKIQSIDISLSELQGLERNRHELHESQMSEISSINKRIAELEENVRVMKENKNKIVDLINKNNVDLMKNNLYELRQKRDVAVADRTDITKKIAQWESFKTSKEDQSKSLTELSDQLDDLEKECRIRKVIVDLFHRDGIPLMKIQQACVLIERYANEMIFDVMPHYSLKVEATVGSGKSGGNLNFMVSTPTGIHPYNCFSGGEKKVIDVCLRMSLSRILAEGSGRRFETLFLDEVFADLDDVHRGLMMQIVKKLSKSFKTIFVISHEKEIQNSFPQTILVKRKRDKEESTVSVINSMKEVDYAGVTS